VLFIKGKIKYLECPSAMAEITDGLFVGVLASD
jgi:hypothetical protein